MAKTIGSYKGLWKKEAPLLRETAVQSGAQSAAVAPQATQPAAVSPQPTVQSAPVSASFPISPAHESAADLQNPRPQPESPEQLAHRYRMLVLREHRFKLGRDLLESGSQDPWSLAWMSVTSFGRSFRPWAHERIFALGCYLGVDMSPEILKQLRHPLFMARYRRSMFGLWRLLEILAQKTGQKTGSPWFFRLFYLCPPLGVLIYEKKLQSLLRKARTSPVAVAPVMAGAGQGQ